MYVFGNITVVYGRQPFLFLLVSMHSSEHMHCVMAHRLREQQDHNSSRHSCSVLKVITIARTFFRLIFSVIADGRL